MSYSKKNFAGRFGMMGDLAENAFERWAILNNYNYVRRGWDRPPLERFYELNEFDRSTPDFVLETPKQHLYVDCKGTGQPNNVKIKVKSLEGLREWNVLQPVYFFIWNSKLKKHAFLSYDRVMELIQDLPVLAFENDKNEYYEVPVDFSQDE